MILDQALTPYLSAEHTRTIVASVRLDVETALRNSFGRGFYSKAKAFQGRLSTDPSGVDRYLSDIELYEKCGTFSSELQNNLSARGVGTVLSISTHPDTNYHGFLVLYRDGVEVIIDPSIGQFIKGYRHVFVGTKAQLHNLVVNQTGDGKPYKIWHTKSHRNPQEAFERIWGSTSRPYINQ